MYARDYVEIFGLRLNENVLMNLDMNSFSDQLEAVCHKTTHKFLANHREDTIDLNNNRADWSINVKSTSVGVWLGYISRLSETSNVLSNTHVIDSKRLIF